MPTLQHIQIRDRIFVSHPPYEFVDERGRLGEGAIIDKYWHVREGDVVFDIGACNGLYTLPSCALGAFVYAIEPNEPSCVVIEYLLALNGFTGRCTVVRAAFSNKEGDHPAALQACADPFFLGDPAITTLDNAVALLNVPKVDWIKIDVEGGELLVVEGGLETIKKHRPVVIIEDHTTIPIYAGYCVAHNTRGRIKEILRSLSYNIVEEPFDNRSYIVGWPNEAPPVRATLPNVAGLVAYPYP